MFIFFEDNDASALAHDEAVAVLVIGTGSSCRIIIALGGQRLRLGEAGDSNRTDGRFRAAGQHHVGIIQRDHPSGITDAVGTGRAGRDDCMIGAHQAIFDGYLAGYEIDQPSVDKMRADPARSPVMQHDRLFFYSRQSADSGTDRTASAQLGFVGHVGETGILERLTGGIDTIDDERIDLPLDLVVDAQIGIEAIFMIRRLDLAGDMAFLIGCIKAGDLSRAGLGSQYVAPGRFHIPAQRRYQAHSGYNNTAHIMLLLAGFPCPKSKTATGSGSSSRAGEPLCYFSAIIGPEVRPCSWQHLKIN